MYHELTHRYQVFKSKDKGFSSSGLGKDYSCVLKEALSINKEDCQLFEYYLNHDTNEFEVEADEEGMRQAYMLIDKILEREEKEEILSLMKKNQFLLKARRSFMRKALPKDVMDEEAFYEDEEIAKLSRYYADYDISNLLNIFQNDASENKERLGDYPSLKEVFDEDGNIKVVDIMTSARAYREREDGTGNLLARFSGDSKEIDFNNAWLEVTTFIVQSESTWNELLESLNNGTIQSDNIIGIYHIASNVLSVIRCLIQKSMDFYELQKMGINKFENTYKNINTRFAYNRENIYVILEDYYFYIVNAIIKYYELRDIINNKYKKEIQNKYDHELIIPDIKEEMIPILTKIARYSKRKSYQEQLEELSYGNEDCKEIYNGVKENLSTNNSKKRRN